MHRLVRSETSVGLAVSVRGAARHFGATPALRDLNLDVWLGEAVALVGPNGAGKSTLLRAIAGRVRLDRGEIVRAAHPIGLVSQTIGIYPLLTTRENLEVFGRFHGLSRAELGGRLEWALAWADLAASADQVAKRLSVGLQRRLHLAAGVLHRPRLILLDEPTVGVDPQSRERIWEMLAGMQAEGAALLFSSHQLGEVEERFERVAVLDRGSLVADGPPFALTDGRAAPDLRSAVLRLTSGVRAA
jgi:ABC-2 type transport system ATP-binding protein